MLRLYGHHHNFEYVVKCLGCNSCKQLRPPTQRLSQPTVVLMHLTLVSCLVSRLYRFCRIGRNTLGLQELCVSVSVICMAGASGRTTDEDAA